MYKGKPVTGNEGIRVANVGKFLQWCDSFPFQLSVTRHTTFILLRLIYRYTFYCSAISYFVKLKSVLGHTYNFLFFMCPYHDIVVGVFHFVQSVFACFCSTRVN